MASNNRGCWFAISRCFNSRAPEERKLYSKVSTENIEFEDLATAERRVLEAKKKKQVVTDIEREHVMNGNLDDLIKQQQRMDEERDAQLRRQEEAVRKEEEAYYAAKREAINKKAGQSKPPVTLQIEQEDKTDVGFNFPILPAPMAPVPAAHSSTTVVVGGGSLMGRGSVSMPAATAVSAPVVATADASGSQQKDDDDFDQFLESVKVKQLSIATKTAPVPQPTSVTSVTSVTLSDSESEEEIDFGFWEKAPVLAGGKPGASGPGNNQNRTDSHELDLGLL